jgi:hypothetical protein
MVGSPWIWIEEQCRDGMQGSKQKTVDAQVVRQLKALLRHGA